jgi:hypothetical protein
MIFLIIVLAFAASFVVVMFQAWMLMLLLGVIHSEVLVAVIPVGFETSVILSVLLSLISLPGWASRANSS